MKIKIEELKKFAKKLPLGKIKTIKKYKQGLINSTYKITTSKGKFSLRIYNYKKPSQINFELAVLNKLKGLKIPELVRLNNGFIEKFNNKYAIVYKYIPGNHLNKFTPNQLNEIGQFIGSFHKKCKKFTWNKPRYQFYNLPDNKIKKFTKISKKAKVKHLNLLPKIIKELKENRPNNNLPRGPIHVDIKPENILFYKGKLSGVLDFDNSFIGPLILDLAKSMVWFGTRNKKFYIKDALQIYKGYSKTRKLNHLELEEIHKAIKFAFLSHVFVDYYIRATKASTEKYFNFIINDFYASYKTFNLNEEEFHKYL